MKATLLTLGNGLRTILVPCEAESIAFGLFIDSGSRHETARTAGISHFIEHMLFKGTPSRTPLQITQAIEGRGGNFNACTSEDATVYFAHLPHEHLEEAVEILTDMYLRATMPADEFAREKQVVIEEIRMYADEPDSVAAENLQAAIFPGSRLGAPVAGSAKSLGPLRPEDLRRYVASHYLPSNTIAVLVGRFDADAARRILERHLGSFRRRAGSFTRDMPDAQAPKPFVVDYRDVQQAQIALGYRTFGIGDPRRYAAVVADAVLGRGMSSRLFQEVREKRGLSYDIASRMHFFQDAGLWTVTAGLDALKIGETLMTVDRELRRLCRTRVSAAELARTKEFLTGNFRLSHEKVTSKLFFYGTTALALGDLITPEEQVEGILAVTADDVRAAAREIFEPSRRTLSIVLPARYKKTGIEDLAQILA